MPKSCKIIAETAFSHEGDEGYLLAQVDAAADGMADYVKLQVLLDPENYTTPTNPALTTLRQWTFSESTWKSVFAKARSIGLGIAVLPLTVASLDFSELATNREFLPGIFRLEPPAGVMIYDLDDPSADDAK